MRKKSALKYITVILILWVTIWFAKNQYNEYLIRKNQLHAIPENNIEKVLAKRLQDSKEKFNSELGKSIQQRNWHQSEQLLAAIKPEKNASNQLADIVRSLYTLEEIDRFTPDDLDGLYSLILPRLHYSSNLSVQFFRLKYPASESKSHLKITECAKSDLTTQNTQTNQDCFKKIIQQDPTPSTEMMEKFLERIRTKNSADQNELLQSITLIRIKSTQATVLNEVAKLVQGGHFKQADSIDIITNLFAENLPQNKNEIIELAFKQIKCKSQRSIESSLRLFSALILRQWVDTKSMGLLRRQIQEIPQEFQTPFVKIKSKELIELIQNP